MIRRRSSSSSATVDLIPMIDVVFQLILFFLVSTTFAILPAISVKLPGSETATGVAGDSITITAEKNGTLWFNEKKVTYSQLENELKSYDTGKIKKEDFPVKLEADEDVTNGTIVKIFDVLRKSGFAAVNLRTTQK
ncbi:MAG: biopolymer transporter ExbD [Treponemataceae bacterium]|nr:biopolymer transporter ExbD [Spirochaetales bacterium]MDY6030463.1 biopolymer transporter ExbD [Treponemataceae bacterium]